MIWMTTPVQHFETVKGEYDPAALGKQCQPLKAWYEVRLHHSRGTTTRAATPGLLSLPAAGVNGQQLRGGAGCWPAW